MKLQKIIFDPKLWLSFYVFILWTSVHHFSFFLKAIFFGHLLFLACLFISLNAIFVERKTPIPSLVQIYFVACFFNIAIPIFSSMVNESALVIFKNSEYISFTYALVLSPMFFLFFNKAKTTPLLALISVFGVLVFGCIVLYRYLVLGEVTPHDMRLFIKIKNGDPNFIATIIGCHLPLCLYLLKRTKDHRHILETLFYLTVCFCFLAIILLTKSRMGLIAPLVVMIPLFFLVKWPAGLKPVFWLVLAAAIFSLLFFGQEVFERFSDMSDRSNAMRFQSWIAGIKIFMENPFFGAGWHTSAKYFYSMAGYPLFQSDTGLFVVHNTFLQILSDCGFIGFLAFSSIIIPLLWSIWQNLKQHREIAWFTLASFVVLFLNSLTLPLYGKDFVMVFLAILLAMNLASDSGADKKGSSS